MSRLSNDVLVLFCTLVWGCNFAIVKTALRQIPEFGFNAIRLAVASTLFLAVLAFYREPVGAGASPRARGAFRLFSTARTISAREWLILIGLAFAGHLLYQLCFLGGLARTTVANSSLIIGTSPVVVTALTALVGHERVSRMCWAGGGLSLVGVYLILGGDASLSGTSLRGDLITLAGVFCWGIYAVGARPLMVRHTPIAVTGYSMAIGTLMYLPFGVPTLLRLDWQAVGFWAWAALVFSAVFALFVSYLIWYTSIKRVGNVRTAMYSNLSPVIALATAVLFLGDQLTRRAVIGAAAILVGVAVARRATPGSAITPAEE